MHIVIVNIHIKPESVGNFISATLDNANNSIQEHGIVRFDFFQQDEDPTRFTLLEVYKSETDPAKHRETPHYIRWRDSVADMMVEPRSRITYHPIFPASNEW